ncbi:hypothetical protein L1987_20069 [Smallanthus sonchifolius]|uniref:Uncharacterized protein n=1 Tax=Smallanthus sonchifolius TaxID=185202 RepID=A0ACB9IQT3_9ASTR|nr:hypothetical protein L1987_20069 [Smallanthus sonchifolius]
MPSQPLTIGRLGSQSFSLEKRKKVWRLIYTRSKRFIDYDREDPSSGEDEDDVPPPGACRPMRGSHGMCSFSPMTQQIHDCRSGSYTSWNPTDLALYDQGAEESLRQEHWRQEEARLNQAFRTSMLYNHETDISNQYRYDVERRHWHDYSNGLPYTEISPRVDWRAVH